MVLLVVILAILFIATLILWIYWLLFKRKYTRERFAFALLLNYTPMVLAILDMLSSSNYIIATINYVLVKVFSMPEIHFDEPDLGDKCLALIIVFIYIKYTASFHKNWDGGKSVNEENNARIIHNHYVLSDAFNFVRYKDARNLVSIDDSLALEDAFFIQNKNIPEKAWRFQLADLLKLISTQYKINVEEDWYAQENCYISHYGQDNQVLAIYCSHNEVSDSKLIEFVNFVHEHKKNNDIKFIWGIRDAKDITVKSIKGVDIEIVTEKSLLDNLVNFSDYTSYIKKAYEQDQIYEGYGLTINDVYVEPTCSIYNAEDKSFKALDSIERYVGDWLNDDLKHQQLALLGEYGQGKSVLSLRLAYLILTGAIKTNRLPIIVNLRGRYLKQYNDPIEILTTWACNTDLNVSALMKLHNAGRLLIIFEGFDELDLIGDKEIRREHFLKLWEFSHPKSKIIITGRPNYFLDDQEMVTLLRLSNQNPLGSKYCESITLQPFNKEQIQSSLRKLSPKVKEEIIQVYDQQSEKSSFRDLVSRPSLLFLTGLIWENDNLASKSDTINSADVIKSFLMYSYKRQDEKVEKGQRILMNSDERAYFMQGIALEMVKRNGYTNSIQLKELEGIVESLYKGFPDKISSISLHSNKKKLQNRLDKTHILEAIQTDIRSCGVLVKDFAARNTFRFAHKSFLELLVADFFADYYLIQAKSDKDIRWVKINSIVRALDIYPNMLTLQRNVLCFIVELLSARMNLEGLGDDRSRVISIYKQLNFYPVHISVLGFLMGIFGIQIYMSLFLYLEVALIFAMIYYFSHEFFDTLLMRLVPVIVVVAFFLIIAVLSTKSKTLRNFVIGFASKRFYAISKIFSSQPDIFNMLQDKKVYIFYLVCKNRQVEQALKNIWSESVFRKVAKVSERYVSNEQSV